MGYFSDLMGNKFLTSLSHQTKKVRVTKTFLPLLKQQKSLIDIVFIGSEAALVGARQGSIYCASKFAVRGFTESLAKEMKGTKVQIHCVYPGHIGTNIVLNAKFGDHIVRGKKGRGVLGFDGKPAKNTSGKEISEKEAGINFRDAGMDPDKAAKIILKGVKKNKTRIFIGIDSKIMELAQRLLPDYYWRLMPYITLLGLLLSPERLIKAFNALKKNRS